MDDQKFPFPIDDFLASIVEAMKVRGDARAIATLIEGQCCFQLWDQDFGIDSWRMFVALPVPLYYAMTEDERESTQESIKEVGSSFFGSLPSDHLGSVVLAPKMEQANDGWREEAMRFIKGEGVTNQGRVRSDNVASKQHLGLLFRSKETLIN